MTFGDLLKQKKKGLKESSIQTYLRNIRRLRKVHGSLPVPETASDWLTDEKLFAWFDKQSLSVRRHLATAAITASVVYGKAADGWKKRQKVAMKAFDQDRRKRQLTDKQKKKIPQDGFQSLKKAVTDMKRELSHILVKPSAEWNKRETLRVQDLLILSLYVDRPLRLDFAGLRVGEVDGNCIFKSRTKPRGWHVNLKVFKTDKSMGPQRVRINPANQRLLNKYIPASNRLFDHDSLLTNQSGDKMSKQVLSKRLHKLTKERVGKAFSVQLLRILFAMQNRGLIESAKEVSDRLLHSQAQSMQYAKKD